MLITASKIAAPVLFTSLSVGVLISILQVATQIQEMTLTFVPKIIAAVAVLLIAGSWMLGTLSQFTRDLFMLASTV
ncbi:MAG: hypothetical protein COA42_16910 [Alteromonadaceae bacterium]|nr:MAG: hypothetical protein COA42_16910 [Alteromonadaceae bacterium]